MQAAFVIAGTYSTFRRLWHFVDLFSLDLVITIFIFIFCGRGIQFLKHNLKKGWRVNAYYVCRICLLWLPSNQCEAGSVGRKGAALTERR